MAGVASADRLDLLEALAALRASGEPLVPNTLRALADSRLRELLERLLARSGRVLVSDSAGRLTIGYDDTVADALVARGIGVLEPVDRAVLCLVLLLSVAAPRARGQLPACDDWSSGRRLSSEQLLGHFRGQGLSRDAISDSVTRLKHLGLLRAGQDIAPGPSLARLTPRRRSELWEDLVLICAPTSSRASFIAGRRQATKERA